MTRFNGRKFFARYDKFELADEVDKYRLSKLGKFSGSTEDRMRVHKNKKFTTHDWIVSKNGEEPDGTVGVPIGNCLEDYILYIW